MPVSISLWYSAIVNGRNAAMALNGGGVVIADMESSS
jgi:hypothetical protein